MSSVNGSADKNHTCADVKWASLMLNTFEIAFNLVSLFYFLLKWKHWDTKSGDEKGFEALWS